MKINRSIRLISLFLFAIMLLSSFAACAETQDPEVTTDAPSAAQTTAPTVDETTADPTKDANGYLKDDLPEDLNYNTDITLLVWDDVEHEEFEVAYENLSGDIVEQSLYDRNSKVEERLGLNLNFIRITGNGSTIKSWNAYVGNSVSINAREFDIIAGYSISVAKHRADISLICSTMSANISILISLGGPIFFLSRLLSVTISTSHRVTFPVMLLR